MKSLIPTLLCAWVLTSKGATLSSYESAPGLSESLAIESAAAVARGQDWLIANQGADGSWSNPDFPALTALPLQAFVHSPHPEARRVIDAATRFLLSRIQPDGGIYAPDTPGAAGGLAEFNTAASMVVLHARHSPALRGPVRNARRFLMRRQAARSFHYGPADTSIDDLLQRFYILQAMRITRDIDADAPDAEWADSELGWRKVIRDIARLHSGGAEANRAGSTIACLGLLGLIYADISREDAHARSAFEWVAAQWSVGDEDSAGSFFLGGVLARALNLHGGSFVPLRDGELLDWRRVMARRLIAAQHTDARTGHGFWVNPAGAFFWENDPVLATTYCILALEVL